MSVYIVKEKGSSSTSFICSAPKFEYAVRLLRGLENADRELGDYKEDRYGILQREYCPAFNDNCEHYMVGICSLRCPEGCDSYTAANASD